MNLLLPPIGLLWNRDKLYIVQLLTLLHPSISFYFYPLAIKCNCTHKLILTLFASTRSSHYLAWMEWVSKWQNILLFIFYNLLWVVNRYVYSEIVAQFLLCDCSSLSCLHLYSFWTCCIHLFTFFSFQQRQNFFYFLC